MLAKTQNAPWKLDRNALEGIGIAIWWFYLNIASIEWLFTSLEDSSIFNTLLLVAVISSLTLLGFWHRHRLKFSPIPQWDGLPLPLILATGLAALAVRWSLDVPQLSATLFLIGTYSLVGLFIDRQIWRSGLAVAILFACVFPLSLHISIGLGFPLRVMTAHVVEHLLTTWGLAAISSHDIIVLEGRIAYVDLPCSGLKSFWTGTIFFLAATWLENRQINWHWFAVFLTHIVLLVGANIGRVAALVLINNGLQASELAQIVHLPLGILGFSSACFISWVLLRSVSKNEYARPNFNWRKVFFRSQPITLQADRTVNLTLNPYKKAGICLLLTGLILIPQPLAVTSEIANVKQIELGNIVQLQDLPLSNFESQFFGRYANTETSKKRFEVGNLTGSLILVSTTSWKAHHAPELCLTGNGLRVEELAKKQLSEDVKGRWLSLNNNRANAAYWFQSRQRTTDDFLDRYWSDITRQEKSWTLVSILFDRPTSSDAPEVKTLVNELHRGIVALQ